MKVAGGLGVLETCEDKGLNVSGFDIEWRFGSGAGG